MLVIPSRAYSSTLRFYWAMATEEPGPAVHDTLTVALYEPNPGGALLHEITVINNATPQSGTWNVFEADLSGYAGQTVDLHFQGQNDALNRTWFYVDDVSLTSCTNLLYLPMLQGQ